MKNLFFAIFVFSILFGCAGVSPEQMAIGDTKIGIGYDNKGTPDGYYSLVEKNGDDWSLVSISNKPIKSRNSKKQEIIFIDKNLLYAQPVFEKVRYFNGSTFECGFIMERDEDFYTPCSSEFTKNSVGRSIGKNLVAGLLTAGLASGTHQELDRETIAQAIKQTGLIARAKMLKEAEEKDQLAAQKAKELAQQECIAKQSAARGFLERVQVNTFIENKSGYSLPDVLVNVSKDLSSPLSCPLDLDNFTYRVRVESVQPNYQMKITPEISEFKFGGTAPIISAKIIVDSKTFNAISPNATFKNEDLIIVVNDVKVDKDGDINFTFDVSNSTNNYINIEKYSMYINGSILTPIVSTVDLPPGAVEKEINATIRYNSDKIFTNAIDSVRRCENKKQCDLLNIKLGFSAKYNIGNSTKTLFDSKDFQYGRIAYLK